MTSTFKDDIFMISSFHVKLLTDKTDNASKTSSFVEMISQQTGVMMIPHRTTRVTSVNNCTFSNCKQTYCVILIYMQVDSVSLKNCLSFALDVTLVAYSSECPNFTMSMSPLLKCPC